MKILSLNVNDFGGAVEYREEYKKLYGTKGYIKRWDKLDKTSSIVGILGFITGETPTIVILQEFDLNSPEAKGFTKSLDSAGYEIIHELPSNRPSMTVMFIKKEVHIKHLSNPHDRSLRACVIEINNYIIYGTHIPPCYDDDFWEELFEFYNKYQDRKIALVGDFNTVNLKNRKKCLELICNGAIDAWVQRGNSNETPTINDDGRLDRVFMSASMYDDLNNIQIVPETLNNMTDHAALIVDIK